MNQSTLRAGGFSALILAASYIIGFVMWGAVLGEPAVDTLSGKVAFVTDNLNALTATTIFIYHIPGIALVLLVLGLREHLGSTDSVLASWGAALGFIWAGIVLASGMIYVVGAHAIADLATTDADSAATSWHTITVISDALGGGSELVGALWVLGASIIAHRSGRLPKALIFLGYFIAVAGILTVLPQLSVFQAVFGLTQIPWFAWVGMLLLGEAGEDPMALEMQGVR
jgi:hypothetical protein